MRSKTMPGPIAPAAIEDRLYDLGDSAERVGVSPRTMYSMWQAGGIPTVYVGRLRKCRASDLAQYISNLPAA